MKHTTHADERARHLARQARSDALKTLRGGLETWITVPDFDAGGVVRCRVAPLDATFSFYGGKKALCLLEGELQAALIVEKDGTKVYKRAYHVPTKKIFGVVLESHPVKL